MRRWIPNGPRTRLLVWRKEQLPEEERDYLRRLCDHEPMIALAYELAQEFTDMARERKGHGFDDWLTRATTSSITSLTGSRVA